MQKYFFIFSLFFTLSSPPLFASYSGETSHVFLRSDDTLSSMEIVLSSSTLPLNAFDLTFIYKKENTCPLSLSVNESIPALVMESYIDDTSVHLELALLGFGTTTDTVLASLSCKENYSERLPSKNIFTSSFLLDGKNSRVYVADGFATALSVTQQ